MGFRKEKMAKQSYQASTTEKNVKPYCSY